MDRSALLGYGIDWDAGVGRCLNNEELYRHIMSLFLEDDSFQRATAAYRAKDDQALFRCAHELKGASGNVALTELFSATSALVECLRAGNADPHEVDRLFAAMEKAYARALEGVKLALEA